MRDEKEERKKQARSNKQTRQEHTYTLTYTQHTHKATQHTHTHTPPHTHTYTLTYTQHTQSNTHKATQHTCTCILYLGVLRLYFLSVHLRVCGDDPTPPFHAIDLQQNQHSREEAERNVYTDIIIIRIS